MANKMATMQGCCCDISVLCGETTHGGSITITVNALEEILCDGCEGWAGTYELSYVGNDPNIGNTCVYALPIEGSLVCDNLGPAFEFTPNWMVAWVLNDSVQAGIYEGSWSGPATFDIDTILWEGNGFFSVSSGALAHTTGACQGTGTATA